jgi:hypothetical protein
VPPSRPPLSLLFGIPICLWSRTPLPHESLNPDHGVLAMKDRSSEGIRDTNFEFKAYLGISLHGGAAQLPTNHLSSVYIILSYGRVKILVTCTDSTRPPTRPALRHMIYD